MEVIHQYQNFPTNIPVAITIGTFDGVHMGHRKIIDQVITVAKAKNLKSAVLTFFPHPRMVIQSADTIALINTIDERITLLAETDLDYLIIHPFDKPFANLTAFEFVRTVLVNSLNTQALIIGYDHRFGKNREGDFEQLKELSDVFEFELQEIEAQDINNISVSSTKIRNALQLGDIQTANQYLTIPFSLEGVVVKGQQLGRTIHYPTANIAISEAYKLIPKNGVYLTQVVINNQKHWGMLNIGNRPTVNGQSKTIEVHIFNFDMDIYQQTIKVFLIDYLREEQKFESIQALQQQLSIDQKNCFQLIENHHQ